jgi:murein DD-endopeptidase MepM/ murein hydrolase activator NlpD
VPTAARLRICLLTLALILLVACAPDPRATPLEPTRLPASTPTVAPPTGTPTRAAPTATLLASSTPSPTPGVQVCSPLEGIPLANLPELVSNPYAPPLPGSDDPHHGVDLALLDPATRLALAGHPVQAALPGIVAGTIRERFPYGNAVLVETPLEELPAAWLDVLLLPTPAPVQLNHPVLTCPTPSAPLHLEVEARSLYLLYAHLLEPPEVISGEALACGAPLGAVGLSGNTLNPHLHLEVRVGPSGLRFESLAHYTASASPQEMGDYCLWRVSGAFQPIDPLAVLLGLEP